MFKHDPVALPHEDLITEQGNGKRLYVTPKGKYPSITTVLGSLPKPGLDAWRKRVGEEEANRVMRRAATRGTAVHELFERYVNNEEGVVNEYPLHIQATFLDAKPTLDKHLTKVYQQEAPLYSNHLGIAGRVDLVGEWDGKPCILDYKTSKSFKKKSFCENYFMQEAGYAVMWEELTGQPITQLVTLIAGDEGVQVFVEHRDNWIGGLIDAKKHFDSLQG